MVANHMKGEIRLTDMREDNRPMPTAPLPENPVVAMAYIPFQQFDRTFAPERALEAGTLFPELDKPFYGKQVMARE